MSYSTILAADDVTGLSSTGKALIEAGGWSVVIVLVLFGALALHKGWVLLGREGKKLEQEIAGLRVERDREVAELKADRDRWLAVAYQGAELVEKQGTTMKEVAQIAAKGQHQ